MIENQHIEFKESWQDEYLKVITAFANAEGGVLYIGVNDKAEPIGISESKIKPLLENLPNKIKNKLNLTASVKEEIFKNKKVLKIEIEPSNYPISCDGKFYFKSGSTVQELSGIELSAFLLEKTGQTWDRLTIDAEIEDLDTQTIELFKKLSKPRLPFIMQETDTKLLLQKLGLISKDGKMTRAAVLLFGKDPQQYFISAYSRVGRFKTDIDILDSVDIRGNLFQQLDGVFNAIKKHLNVRFDTSVREATTEALSRRDIWDYPLDAVREIIINALIHRDYLDTSPIQIKIYDDKIVFWNSGKLLFPLTVESLKTSHSGRQRNPLIASVFYYAGNVEQWGSGTLKVLRLFKEQGLPEPEFAEQKEGIGDFTVYFYKDRYTEEELRKAGLNERQIKAVFYVKEKGRITNREYQEITGVKKRQASIDLAELEKESIIKKIGSTGKGTFYVLRGNNWVKGAIKE